MNKENNLLDNLIHNSVEDAQFAFKEEYWDKMEALLDEEDKDKKRPFFWRWFSIIIAVLVVGGGTLLYSKLNSNNKITNSKEESSKVENSNIQNSNSNEKSTKTETPTANEGNINAENNNTTTNTANNIEVNNTQPTINTAQKSYRSDVVENVNNQTTNTKEESANVNSTTHQKTKNENENVVFVNNRKGNASKNKSTKSNTKEIEKSLNENVEPKSEVEYVDEKIATSNKLKTKNSKLKTSITGNRQLTTDITTSDNSKKDIVEINGKPMVKTNAETFIQKEMIDQSRFNPRYNAALKDYVPEVYDSITILTYKPVKEEVAVASTPKEKAKFKEPFEPQPFSLFMLVGANMNKGFAGNVANELKWGVAPYVGAGFEKPIANKISISSNVGFTYFNGLNLQKTVSGNSYSFGLDSSSFSVYHKKMFQLNLPISVYYQLFKNHYLMGGIGASYAMNVSSTYEEVKGTSTGYNTISSKPYTNYTTTSTKNQLGFTNGFNQFDMFLHAGYSYQVFKNWMLQLGVQKGLFDATKNTYFNNTIKNTQTRFSLGIKYSFKRNNN